jgi:hypothetical protein
MWLRNGESELGERIWLSYVTVPPRVLTVPGFADVLKGAFFSVDKKDEGNSFFLQGLSKKGLRKEHIARVGCSSFWSKSSGLQKPDRLGYALVMLATYSVLLVDFVTEDVIWSHSWPL